MVTVIAATAPANQCSVLGLPSRPVPCCRQPLVNAPRPLSRSTDSRGCRKRTIHNAEQDASFPFAMPGLRVLRCLRNPCPVLPSRRIDYTTVVYSPHPALPASVVLITACHCRQPTGRALLVVPSARDVETRSHRGMLFVVHGRTGAPTR